MQTPLEIFTQESADNPAQTLDFIKNRTKNNINWDNLSKTSEEIAKTNNTSPERVAYELLQKYSTPDENGKALFSIQPQEDKSLAPSTEKLDSYESGITSLEGAKNLGLDIIDTLGFSGFSDSASERKRDIDIYLREQAKKGTPYEELHEQAYWNLSGLKGSVASRMEYEDLKKEQTLLQKDKNTLSDEDKAFINRRVNPLTHLFSDYTNEDLKDFEDKVTQAYVAADVQSKLQFLNNIDEHKSLHSIIGGSDEALKQKYLQSVNTIAQTAGFEGIAYDEKGEVYFYDSEKIYKPNQDFFGNFLNILAANTGSIGGGITGAVIGAKNAKSPQQLLAGSVIGAGLGSMAGASVDVLITNARLDRETTLRETLAHSLEEGLLSVVGDVAIIGGSEALKRGIKVFADSNLAKTSKEFIKNTLEYTPFVGFAMRLQDGNAKAAMKLLHNSINESEAQALKEFADSFGGGLDFDKATTSKTYERLRAKFGDEHFITKGAKILNDSFMLSSQAQTQKQILHSIRADESGNLIGFLIEAANQSPNFQKNLKHILNQTTFNLKKQLEYLQIQPNEIKEIFSNFEKGTKTEYVQAMEDILGVVYDDSYKVVLSKEGVNKHEARGIHNVTHNGKNATIIHKDLQNIDEAILYTSGNRYKGAKHIRIKHSKESSKQGYVTDSELANLGRDIREFLKHNEPFIDSNGARLYEWEKDGVKFRAVVNDIADMDSNPTTAIEEIITFYSDRNLKEPMRFKNPSLTHPKESYAQFRKKLESSGILPEDSMKFLNFVEKNIYNEKGVTFAQLNNALKLINSYYKEARDPNLKSFIKQSVEGFLREDIKRGIDSIFAQNKTLYKDAQALFSTALNDYAKMKSAIKMIDKLKVRDETISYQKAYENLYKYLQGQGGELDNLTKLTKDLPKEQAARVELNILYQLFNQSLREFDNIQVFDSKAFFTKLEGVQGHFSSQGAKDFINIAQGFDTLFRNDTLIADALRKSTTDKIGSSIATSIEGAVKFQAVKMMFEHIVRLLPHIPFLSSLNEKIQGAALRFHIKSALAKSIDVQDFKITLHNKATFNKELNSPTKKLINKIIGKVDGVQDTIIEQVGRDTARANNAKDLQEYNTLKAYDVESLELLGEKEYRVFVDSVLSGDENALKSAPSIVHIANLNSDLVNALGIENAKIFLRKNDLHHFRSERKAKYNQDAPREVIDTLPQIISEAKSAYIDTHPKHKNFFITKDLNDSEVATIHINKDNIGNYVVTLRRVHKDDLKRKELVRTGIEPDIQRLSADQTLRSQPTTSLTSNKNLEAVGLAPTIPTPTSESYQTTTLLPSTSKQVDSTTQSLKTQNLESLQGKTLKADGKEWDLYKHAMTLKTYRANGAIEKKTQQAAVIREHIQKELDIKPLKEFGTNYAEGYHDGAWSIQKLLDTKEGQVAGAFHREDIGDITLAWGEAGSGKSDGWGLAKIQKYHPEVLDRLDELVQGMPITKETPNRYQLENENYKIAIRKDYDGENGNWLLTAFEKKESIARRRTDLPSTETATEKTTSVNASENSTQKLFKSQDIALDSSDEFIQYAKLAGVEFKDEREARQAYKYIQSRLKDLEC